jgi:hypothetical protein
MIARARGARHRFFAIRVKELVAAGWRDEDRRVIFRPENLDAHVDLGDVVETSRPKLEFQETFAVRAQRHLVVEAGGHIAEMRRGNVSEGGRLEVEDVDRLLCRLDRLAAGTSPDHRIRPFRGRFVCQRLARQGGKARRRKQRARRDILQEAAAAGGADVRWHAIPL